MVKLRINEKWASKLLELEMYTHNKDLEIDIINYEVCNISHFRKLLHTIVDLNEDLKNKEVLHTKINSNDFTVLVLVGVLKVLDKNI